MSEGSINLDKFIVVSMVAAERTANGYLVEVTYGDGTICWMEVTKDAYSLLSKTVKGVEDGRLV